jgi:hypothetical protein
LRLSTPWQLLLDGVTCNVRLFQPLAIGSADARNKKQFVGFSGPIQIPPVDADEVRHFEALIDTQVGVGDSYIPRNLLLLASVQPVGYGNRFEIEPGRFLLVNPLS